MEPEDKHERGWVGELGGFAAWGVVALIVVASAYWVYVQYIVPPEPLAVLGFDCKF